MRGAEVKGGTAASVDVIVIGHVGESIVHSGSATRTSTGGSGYAAAASAAALIGRRVGLVAQVGMGFDLALLRRLAVDLTGVTELPGPSAKLRIREFGDGTRSFSAELGVAQTVQPETFPLPYLRRPLYSPRHRTARSAARLAGLPARPRAGADFGRHVLALCGGQSLRVA